MTIEFKRKYGSYIIFKADNVCVEEDVEEVIYPRTGEGKIDYSKTPIRDVDTKIIEQFADFMDNLVYYRERDFDSSTLIKTLFEKLPQNICDNMLIELNRDYGIENSES